MIGIERAETAEAGVDDPKLVVVIPSELVDVDVARDMNASRQIAGVVLARRLELFGQCRHVAILPDGVGAADCQAGMIGDDTHGFGECSEMSVEPAVIVSNDDGLTCLISGNDKADPESVE